MFAHAHKDDSAQLRLHRRIALIQDDLNSAFPFEQLLKADRFLMAFLRALFEQLAEQLARERRLLQAQPRGCIDDRVARGGGELAACSSL